jgi:hypothetical protein
MTSISHHDQGWVRPERSVPSLKRVLVSNAGTGCLAFLVSAWQAAENWIAPLGYEDAMGFHYGEEPVVKSDGRHRSAGNGSKRPDFFPEE